MSSSNDVGDGSGSSSLSTFFQRYHDVQKTDVAVNQLNIKAFWDRMDKELTLCPRDDPGTTVNELKLINFMNIETSATEPKTNVSANAAKLMAKACEMFVLELTMRSYQAKLDATDGILKEEDVLRALNTSEPHDMFVP